MGGDLPPEGVLNMKTIANWKDYLIEENATEEDMRELLENYVDDNDGGLLLVDGAGTDYTENFWNRFGHMFDDKILNA